MCFKFIFFKKEWNKSADQTSQLGGIDHYKMFMNETLTPKERSQEIPESLQAYLREMGKTPLLSLEEEKVLARKIRAGDKRAKEQMIKANLRLVVKIATDYLGNGVPLIDLISEGNVGLIKAVERFRPNKGAKFSTYGAWWIKQCIRRGLANYSKTIRLPMHMVDKLQKLRRITHQLYEELGREPSVEELASEMQISVTRVNALMQTSVHAVSLDEDLKIGNHATTLSDIIGDRTILNPSEQLSLQDLRETLVHTFETLESRERQVIALRYGLSGHRRHTLDEVGRRFKVTRERIRQIQNIALKKMRSALMKKDKKRFIKNGIPLDSLRNMEMPSSMLS